MKIRLTVNDQLYEREIKEHATLLEFLRYDVGLAGTKGGCEAGECGACTVILDGKVIKSCLVLAAEADGSVIETIEGEAQGDELSTIQAAFAKHHAVQCGFCTPGMIMSVKNLLQRYPKPTREQILHGIEGNFCRCTGYQQIIEAVEDAAGLRTEKGDLDHV